MLNLIVSLLSCLWRLGSIVRPDHVIGDVNCMGAYLEDREDIGWKCIPNHEKAFRRKAVPVQDSFVLSPRLGADYFHMPEVGT